MTLQRLGNLDVSRETIDDLRQYTDMLQKWTKSINLIAPSTVSDIWNRHIADSAQIYRLKPPDVMRWLDLGSGGGLPAIVVAIIAKHQEPHLQVTMIESDQRKAVFLRSVVRKLELNSQIIAKRIDDTDIQDADVVSARALASISDIMPFLQHHLSNSGVALLHKGKTHRTELAEAAKRWVFDLEEHVSLTDPDARLLSIRNISSTG